MTFHTYVSINSVLGVTVSWKQKKAKGQMDNYMTRDHYDLLFFALCFSGRVILLQFESIIFKVSSKLINSMSHFT